ncbi:MAG: hypothetical protein PHO78_05110 [Methanomicrobium sp.]|nr:hypothetical protein [Methanomicrobium sp.]
MKNMEKGKILVIILAIALIACAGYIVLKSYPGLFKSADVNSGAAVNGQNPYSEYQTAEVTSAALESGAEETASTYLHKGEVYATPSVIKSMDLYVEPVDWDSVAGNDGVVIHFNFYDAYGRKVIFSGHSIDCTIEIYTPQTDTLMRSVNPRKVLYKGYTTITCSDQGEGGSLAGIRVGYSDLNLGQYDRGIGQIKITASLPAGGYVTAEETYLYPRH